MHEYAAVIGAGKSGCGFIGRLLSERNVPFIVIDTDDQALQRVREGYDVRFYGSDRCLHIYPEETYHSRDSDAWKAVADARIIFVSVGFQNLRQVGQWLTQGTEGPRCPILVCENGSGAAEELEIGAGMPLNAASAAIFCTTERENGVIFSQDFSFLYYDRPAVEGLVPSWDFLVGEDAFSDLMARKLYTYNAASAVICYLGWEKGYTLLSDAANDPDIREALQTFYQNINIAICREFSCSKEEQESFSKMSFEKFTDPSITDTIQRNARNPLRKLTHSERIIGPYRLLCKYGLDTAVMDRVLDAALAYARSGEQGGERNENH